MKKFMAMLLTLVMALSLVACGQQADGAKQDDAADTDDVKLARCWRASSTGARPSPTAFWCRRATPRACSPASTRPSLS